MRRSKEILILLALLLGAVAFVLWYVADRRARQRSAPPAAKSVGPVLGDGALTLDQAHGKTLDLSTGVPIVRDSPEDRAAIEEAMKDIEAATRDLTFGPDATVPAAEKKPAEPKIPPPRP